MSLAMVTATWFESHHVGVVGVVVDRARVDNIRLRLVAISTLLSPSQVPNLPFCNPMPPPSRLNRRPLPVDLPQNADPSEQLGPPNMLPV